MNKTDLQTLTTSLRAAVDAGDIKAIANGVATLERLVALERSVHNEARRITRIIRRGADLGQVRTVGHVLNAGSNWLRRHVFDDPDVVFQVEGDDRWFEATTLFVMEEADPDVVGDLFEDEQEIERQSAPSVEDEPE